MGLLKHRYVFYLILLLASTGFFIEELLSGRFNQDEFQNTYLAWATVNFNELIYRDFFDNHGPIHSFINSIFLWIINPEPGLNALLQLRSFNVFLLLLNFLTCFELFYIIIRKYQAILFLPLFFAISPIPEFGVQIRPDTLQGVFLNLSLISIILSFQKENKKLALLGGVFLSLMLFTNLKSLVAVAAILFGFLVAALIFKNKIIWKLALPYALIGLILSYLFGLGVLAVFGIASSYINYNVIFNVLLILDPEKSRSWELSNWLYFEDNWIITACFLTSLFFWILSSIRKKSSNRDARLAFGLLVSILISGKLTGLWIQYDMIFMIFLCGFCSWLLYELINFLNNITKKIYDHKNILNTLFIELGIIAIAYYAWSPLVNFSNPDQGYFEFADKNIKKISFESGSDYTVEAFTSTCPGFGFVKHASYMIMKYGPIMNAHEYIEGKEIYDKEYIKLLNQKKVKFILAGSEIYDFLSPKVVGFIHTNYRHESCYWIRKTDFPE